MTKQQQSAYHCILQGVKNLDTEFQIPALAGEELYNVFFQMRLDHPEIFWATGYKYRYYKDSPNIIFIPEYLFDKNKVREHQKAMTARIDKLIRPAQKLSELEKEKYVHDFICENIRYDKLKKSYSHEIIGPLGQGVGVCEGIAKAVKVLLDDQQIFRDHEPLIAPAPHCTDHEHFYYKEKKLSFTKQEDVYKRSLQAAKKGKVLTFHWRGGYLTREVLNELITLIRKAGTEKNKSAVISINWPQAVLRLHYTDIQIQESVTMEDANEGEQED